MSLDSDTRYSLGQERTRHALNLSGLQTETIYLMFRTAVRIALSVPQTDGHREGTGKSLGNEKGGTLMFLRHAL